MARFSDSQPVGSADRGVGRGVPTIKCCNLEINVSINIETLSSMFQTMFER